MIDSIPGPAWIPKFLAALAETKNAHAAARTAGIGTGSAYYQRKRNRMFAEGWSASLDKPGGAAKAKARNWGWQIRFFEALAETSNVTASAARAGVPVRTVYKLKREDPAFAVKWLAALHEGYDHLEMELLGYLRNARPDHKMDVAAASRLLAKHRETVERRRALEDEEDEQGALESIDAFLEGMRQRRLANEAMLLQAQPGDVAE